MAGMKSKVLYNSGARAVKMVVWLFIALASCACAFGLDPSLDVSQYEHRAWKTLEGFGTRSINSIAQTPDGYLWLGTASGLLRFDGVQNIPWSRPPPGERLFVTNLLVSRDGTVWIASLTGLASWKDGKLAEYPEVAGQIATSPVQDSEGTVWVGVYDPGRLCGIRGGRVQCYGAGLFGRSVSALYLDPRGNLWLSAQSGVWRWAHGPAEHYSFPGVFEASALIEGDHGELLMATATPGAGPATTTGSIEGLKQLVGGKIRSYSLPGFAGRFRPKCLFRSSDGSLWIGTVQGLLHLHQGKIDRFTVADGLSGDVVTSIFEDREGSVWVSTGNGLNRFRDYAVPTVSLNQGLSSSSVHLVESTPDGSIWIGTADGLNRWQNGHVTVYGRQNLPDRVGRGGHRELTFSSTGMQIPNSGLPTTPVSLGQDDRGRLLAATREGVFRFESGRFTRIPGVPGGNVFSVAGDGQGKIWISNIDLGLVYSTPEGAVQRIPWARLGHKSAAVALLPDRLQGGLWLGFFDGGIAYLKDGQIRASYSFADGLGSGSVSNLHLGSDGAVWAATGGGLSRLKDGRVTTLTSKQGLPCDSVTWAIEDDDHTFWLYMSCGLVRIAHSELTTWVSDSKRSVQTTLFDGYDGVNGLSGRYRPKVAKALDGKLWFAALDGASVIDPRHLPSNKLPPPVHIEQLTADRTLRWQNSSGAAVSNLRLPALSRDLEIDYTALSLVAPEKIRFKYKLEGYDRDWRDVGNRRQGFYNDLPPHSYRFRVIASNNSGVWNEAGDTLDFAIDPAYYQTTWFRISCFAAFSALVWALYRYRLYQVKHEFNARLEERVGERTRIARELHDTLLQSFQGLMLRFQVGIDLLPAGKAKEALEKALERGDQAIAEGRDSIHDLRSSTVVTNDLAEALRALGDELASQDSATFGVTLEGTPRPLHPILRDEIYRIAREAVRNAFHHAQARRIEGEITYGEKLLRVRIRDDGKGMDPGIAEEGAAGHYGLPGMRERATRIGAQLHIWSGPGAGTEIELSIPGSIAYGTAPAHTGFWPFRRRAG